MKVYLVERLIRKEIITYRVEARDEAEATKKVFKGGDEVDLYNYRSTVTDEVINMIEV